MEAFRSDSALTQVSDKDSLSGGESPGFQRFWQRIFLRKRVLEKSSVNEYWEGIISPKSLPKILETRENLREFPVKIFRENVHFLHSELFRASKLGA